MVYVAIKELNPAVYNPRKWSKKATDDLTASIKRFGLIDPIIVNKARGNTVVGGHFRLHVAKKLGYIEVPCVFVSIEDEQKEKELNLRLNKNSGDWDWSLLKDWETSLLKEAGFDDAELKEMMDQVLEPVKEDDFDPTATLEAKETKVKLGDVWQLGAHRLMCGDSTKLEDVEKLMNGKKADMAHNDPPYGMKKEKDGVLNDNLNYDELLTFNEDWISTQITALKDNGSWYCWGIDEPLMDIYSNILKPYVKENKMTFRNLITWDKGSGQGQNSENTRSFAIADEKCLFAMLGVQGFSNNKDQYFEGWEPIRQYLASSIEKAGITRQDIKRVTGVDMYSHWFSKSQWVLIPEKHFDAINAAFRCFEKTHEDLSSGMMYSEVKDKFNASRAYFDNTHDNFNNVWHFDRHRSDGTEGGHATPKPLPLCQRAIKSSSPVGGLVIDFFAGSGSTLIACEQTKRICYTMELDPKYCDVVIARWEKLTGQTAIKL